MARIATDPACMDGFSAIELLVTITILGVLLSLGVSSMGRLMARQNIVLESEQLISTLNNARITAISMNSRVVLCPSADRRQCSPLPHWHDGLLVFVDRDRDREFGSTDSLLLSRSGSDSDVTIISSRYRRRIVYDGIGVSPGSNVTFSICHSRGLAKPKAVIISNAGRPRRSDTRPQGGPILCATT